MFRNSIAFVLLCSLAACGGKDQPGDNDKSTKDASPSASNAMPHYWLDIQTGEVIVHATKELPPIKLPNGHEAVRAIKWECIGRGGKEKGAFVAYYQKFAPAFKEAVASNKFGDAKDELISVDAKVWVSKMAKEARDVFREINKPCASIGSPKEVYPPRD